MTQLAGMTVGRYDGERRMTGVIDSDALEHDPRSTVPASLTQQAELRDWFTLLKPRVMTLVVFTTDRAAGRARHLHPVLAFTAVLCIAVGAAPARDQHVVRPRHRRPDAANPQPADPRRPASPPVRRWASASPWRSLVMT